MAHVSPDAANMRDSEVLPDDSARDTPRELDPFEMDWPWPASRSDRPDVPHSPSETAVRTPGES